MATAKKSTKSSKQKPDKRTEKLKDTSGKVDGNKTVETGGKVKDASKDGVLGQLSKVANSFFMTMADPNITKVNPNSQTPTKVNEKLQSVGGAKVDELINKIKSKLSPAIGDKFGLKDLVAAVDFKNGFSLNPDVLQARLGGPALDVYNSTKNALEFIEDVKQNGIYSLQKYGGAFGADINNYIQSGFELYQVGKQVAAGDVNALLGAANKFLGGTGLGKFLDLQAEAAWIGALVSKAQELGLPDLIKEIQGKVKDAQSYRRSLARNTRYTASSGDTKMMDLITQVIEGRALLSENPDILQLYLSSYRLPAKYDVNRFDEYRNKVLDILYRVDPHWDKKVFNNEWAYRTDPWLKASKDAKLLFTGTEWEEAMLIASSYPSQSIQDLLKQTYKHYYFTK